MKRLTILCVLALALVVTPRASRAEATTPLARSTHSVWTVAPSMPAPLNGQHALSLFDGRVLVLGGETARWGWPVRWSELYDPGSHTWVTGPAMHDARIAETTTLLRDGRVLVVGGLGYKLQRLHSVEIFDPRFNSWRLFSPLPASRFSQSASLLPDGRVLLAGGIVNGTISRSTLLYDPVGNRVEPGPDMHYFHALQSAVTMTDGRILIAGGYGGNPEIYNPSTETWTALGHQPRCLFHIMTPLQDGTVLMASGVSGGYRDLASSEIFDPVHSTWSKTGSMRVRRNQAAAVLLSDGRVLAIGGEQVTGRVLRSVELYDPVARSWSNMGSMMAPRSAATATPLRDGTVLVCGGINGEGVLDSCEVYHP